MVYVFALVHVVFCAWLLFMDGAEQIEGSWLTEMLYVPGMDAREIRVWAFLSLIWIPIAFLL